MRTIDFPDGWATANPVDHMAFEFEDDLHLAGLLLEDGANLWVLIYPGGERFARTAFAIDWGIEERFGKPPRPCDLARVNMAWRFMLDVIIGAARGADEDMKAMGLPTSREQVREHRRREGQGGA